MIKSHIFLAHMRLLVILLGLCAGGRLPTAEAQMGAPRYKWSTRSQLAQLGRTHANDPRASYDLIVSATKRGMVGTLVQAYDDLLKKDGNNPNLQAAYAFCAYLPVWQRTWDWLEDKTSGLNQKLLAQQGRSDYYRRNSLKLKPDSPGIVLMGAIGFITGVERDKSVQLVSHAVRLAPNCADAHYWQSYILSNFGAHQPSAQWPRYGALMLPALNRAEKLDPSLHGECLFDKELAYGLLGKYREALAMFDAYAQAKPGYREFLNADSPGRFEKQRANLVAQIQKQEQKP